jgi:ubiquitin carboxyl-terminal hydrolase 4/11
LSKDKLEDAVSFPVEGLDLSPFVLSNRNPDGSYKESLIYDLFAVSNHFGNLAFGHYTAFAKNHVTGKWYDFDDSMVSAVPEE